MDRCPFCELASGPADDDLVDFRLPDAVKDDLPREERRRQAEALRRALG